MTETSTSQDSATEEKQHHCYVRDNGTTTLQCPHCMRSKTVPVSLLIPKKQVLKVKCTCGNIFSIRLEFRRQKRKQTMLSGYYCIPTEANDWGRIPDLRVHNQTINCTIKNISTGGIGFSPIGYHNLHPDQGLLIKFFLDNTLASLVEKKVIIRSVQDHYIGCEFAEKHQFNALIGFYVI